MRCGAMSVRMRDHDAHPAHRSSSAVDEMTRLTPWLLGLVYLTQSLTDVQLVGERELRHKATTSPRQATTWYQVAAAV